MAPMLRYKSSEVPCVLTPVVAFNFARVGYTAFSRAAGSSNELDR